LTDAPFTVRQIFTIPRTFRLPVPLLGGVASISDSISDSIVDPVALSVNQFLVLSGKLDIAKWGKLAG
jgi:hypothetical protein